MAYLINKKLGAWGERIACAQYLKQGFVLVARNVYNNRGKMLGELDLVMRTETQLVFVEVKTRTLRSSSKFGSASASITKEKQRRLINSVRWFCKRFPQYSLLNPRIDVCAITVDPLDKSSVNVIMIPSAIEVNC